MGETLRDQAALTRAVHAAAAVADQVTLPLEPAAAPEPRGRPAPGWRRFTEWGGWAVAALLVLAWSLGRLEPAPRNGVAPDDSNNLAAIVNGIPAADLLRAYLDKGRQENLVVGEVPEKILIETRHAPSGAGYELLYLRQVLERAIVPDLYQFTAEDELGRPTLVRFEHVPRQPM